MLKNERKPFLFLEKYADLVQKKVPPHSLMEKDVIKTRFILNLVS